MIKSPDAIMLERIRHDRAARGPKMTFFCAGCNQMRKIIGRRKKEKGGPWFCAICLEKSQETG